MHKHTEIACCLLAYLRSMIKFFLIKRLVYLFLTCKKSGLMHICFFVLYCRFLFGLVNDIAWPFPPFASCLGMHSSLLWLMSGQGKRKSIPRLQRCSSDGWPLRGLSRSDGSWASESPEQGVGAGRQNSEGRLRKLKQSTCKGKNAFKYNITDFYSHPQD